MGIMHSLRFAFMNEMDISCANHYIVKACLSLYWNRIQLVKSRVQASNNSEYVMELVALASQVTSVAGLLDAYLPNCEVYKTNPDLVFRTGIRSPEDYLVVYSAMQCGLTTDDSEFIRTISQSEMTTDDIMPRVRLRLWANAINTPVKKGMNLQERFEHSPLLQLVHNTRS